MASFGNPVSCQKSFKKLNFIKESLCFLGKQSSRKKFISNRNGKLQLAHDFAPPGTLVRGCKASTALSRAHCPCHSSAAAGSDHCHIRGLSCTTMTWPRAHRAIKQWTHSFNLKSCVRPSTCNETSSWHPHARTMPVTAEDKQVRDNQASGALHDEEVGTQDTAW